MEHEYITVAKETVKTMKELVDLLKKMGNMKDSMTEEEFNAAIKTISEDEIIKLQTEYDNYEELIYKNI